MSETTANEFSVIQNVAPEFGHPKSLKQKLVDTIDFYFKGSDPKVRTRQEDLAHVEKELGLKGEEAENYIKSIRP